MLDLYEKSEKSIPGGVGVAVVAVEVACSVLERDIVVATVLPEGVGVMEVTFTLGLVAVSSGVVSGEVVET